MSRVIVRAEAKGSEVNVFPDRSDDAEVAELLRECLKSLVGRFQARGASVELSAKSAFDWARGGVAVVKSLNAIDLDGQVLVDLADKEVQYSIVVDIEGGEKRHFASRDLAMPGHDTPMQIAALEAENARLRRLLEAERAKVEMLQQMLGNAAQQQREAVTQAQQPAAPVPALIEPLPPELEPILGRDAIWSLVRPAPGADDRGVIERHEVFWKRFDVVLKARGPEGSKVLRKPLQDYLDSLVGLRFSQTRDEKEPEKPSEKERIVARLNFMMRSVGVRARFGEAVGPIGNTDGSLRIQAASRLADGRLKRFYTTLGTTIPVGLALAEEPPRGQPRAPRSSGIVRKTGNYKYLKESTSKRQGTPATKKRGGT